MSDTTSGSSGRSNTNTQRIRAMEEDHEAVRQEYEALRREHERLRQEQEQLRRDYEERQRDLYLVSGLDAISTVLENGFEQVIGQLQPLTEFRPPTGEQPLPEPTELRFALLQLTQQRIPADSYQVALTEYDVGFLNDPRDRPEPAGSAGQWPPARPEAGDY